MSKNYKVICNSIRTLGHGDVVSADQYEKACKGRDLAKDVQAGLIEETGDEPTYKDDLPVASAMESRKGKGKDAPATKPAATASGQPKPAPQGSAGA